MSRRVLILRGRTSDRTPGGGRGAQALGERLAARSPLLMRLGKDAMYRQQDMAFADALEYLQSQLTLAFSTEDIKEGVQAFFEKRDPRWTGR